MRRDRLLTIAAGAAVVLMVGASPASADATFAGASAYPSDTDQQLTLDVPEERGPDIHNTGVSVFIPTGWSPLACPAKTSWSCQVIPPAGNQPAEVRWAKDAGGASRRGRDVRLQRPHRPSGQERLPGDPDLFQRRKGALDR